MKIGGRSYRTIWRSEDRTAVEIIDQTALPYALEILRLGAAAQMAEAIRSMQVRGAPLIGVAGVYGLALAAAADATDAALAAAASALCETRPTAVNLKFRVMEALEALRPVPVSGRAARAFELAGQVAEDEVQISRRIGEHGAALIEAAFRARGARAPVNVLTHCNAGWLATVDWGTALAPIYVAQERGIPLHVWVDETRPRNQGYLTAWELGQAGIPHTVIVDNAGGHLMQHGKVDLCIVGTDRTTASGDVCNKIGTYLKALAAKDNGVPFYVAAPESSIDWTIDDGVAQIPIEERTALEVERISGVGSGGQIATVKVVPEGSSALNPGFDVTPARLVSSLITERGVCAATAAGLAGLYPERRR